MRDLPRGRKETIIAIFSATIITPNVRKSPPSGDPTDTSHDEVTNQHQMGTCTAGSGETIQVVPVTEASSGAVHEIVTVQGDNDDAAMGDVTVCESGQHGGSDTKIDIYHISGSEVVRRVDVD